MSDLDPSYVEVIRRMIMASINWIEVHGGTDDLQWQERDIQSIIQALGLPDTMEADQIAFIGPWNDFFRPSNQTTQAWFDVMVNACGPGPEYAPSIQMMKHAMFAGMYVGMNGWDAFNLLMSEPTSHTIN
jgi:hypothetical protein